MVLELAWLGVLEQTGSMMDWKPGGSRRRPLVELDMEIDRLVLVRWHVQPKAAYIVVDRY